MNNYLRAKRCGAAIVLICFFAVIIGAQSAAQLTREDEDARKAYQAKDYTVYRDHLLKLYELVSGNPRVTYKLAAAEALLGNQQVALDWLRTYAEMGLTRDPDADPDFASLKQTDAFKAILNRIEENKRAVSHSAMVFKLYDRELLAEDIAYDRTTHAFYVSSVHERKIVRIDQNGQKSDFTSGDQKEVWAILALALDAKRRILWATTAAIPQAIGYDKTKDRGRSAVLKYDLASGKLVKRYDVPLDGAEHVLGDMTISVKGDAYISDAVSGVVYQIITERDTLEPLVLAGTFISPQTPAITPDDRYLFVADYVRGIGIIDLGKKTTSWLAHPKNVALNGIDGMYLTGQTLLAVQNGTMPMRVLLLKLDPELRQITRCEVIESNTSTLGVPTHGVVVGSDFYYLANSGWDRMTDAGVFTAGPADGAPIIERTTLTSEH